MSSDDLLASLRRAVDAAPDDAHLRLHYAQLLDSHGQREEAVRQAAAVLQREPLNASALAVISGTNRDDPMPTSSPAPSPPPAPTSRDSVLDRLDEEFRDVVPPMFVQGEAASADDKFSVEHTTLRLADVGGMTEVKRRLDAAILAPLRNPELGRLYKKSVRGGLLMYGPPGCGKTFIARAVAGELGAKFLPVSLADVLDMYIGQSERNVHELFEFARRNAPCVIFLDEVDAIGLKRTNRATGSAARGSVNQLLTEMDSVLSDNTGVFVLGATNHPWDVDVALRRPGRFDRMVLVLPPDLEARTAILRYHLSDRPIASIDVHKIAQRTEDFSGADLAYLCEVATERALLDSISTDTVRLIDMNDMTAALADVRPTVGPWFSTARNVAEFANEGGAYDDLVTYLKRRRLM